MVWVLPQAESESFKCKLLLGEVFSRNIGRELVQWHREVPIWRFRVFLPKGKKAWVLVQGPPPHWGCVATSLTLLACFSAAWLMYPSSQQRALRHRGPTEGQWPAKCGFWSSSLSISWGLVKNASSSSAPLLASYITQHCFPLPVGPHCSAARVSLRANFLLFYNVKTQNFLNPGTSAFRA